MAGESEAGRWANRLAGHQEARLVGRNASRQTMQALLFAAAGRTTCSCDTPTASCIAPLLSQELHGEPAEQPSAASPAVPSATATRSPPSHAVTSASDLRLTTSSSRKSGSSSSSSSSESAGRMEPGSGSLSPPASSLPFLPSDVQPVSVRTVLLLAHPGYDADVATGSCEFVVCPLVPKHTCIESYTLRARMAL